MATKLEFRRVAVTDSTSVALAANPDGGYVVRFSKVQEGVVLTETSLRLSGGAMAALALLWKDANAGDALLLERDDQLQWVEVNCRVVPKDEAERQG